MKQYIYKDVKIIIGQNARENWSIIKWNSKYTWLHLDSFPSCHVIIESEDVDLETIQYAASLCKKNTKYKNIPKLYVCYTYCNNLIKGNEVGSVEYKSNKKVNKIVV